ncbi:MAG: UvrD-helicase domain-containing protein [Dysgonamonadaceae bacterium]|jgi:DNA helicase-2/ATP-dependent DNA helicase PcrA|nr:UvrD-helicase domain-containing protein [Dysgonamonadaceae bacterium]
MTEFLQQLNDSQLEAVLYNDGPSLVIAGAGSGKTRVLTCKIAYLLNEGIRPYNILALTFTNKAAREMKNRIGAIVGDDIARNLWMGTFHSVFLRILRRESERLGCSPDFTIYDSQDSQSLIKSIIKELQLNDKQYKPSVIQSRISNAKNALITAEMYAKDRRLIEDDLRQKRDRIATVYEIYSNRCKASDAFDFDDLLLSTYILFRDNPDVLDKYRNMFRFILVDEYQDTNSVQHEIVRQLAGEHQRICVVGDDAQSIYSFRGANIGNILNFQKVYPKTRLFKLEQNYRSTQTIVNAANSLIKNNDRQIPKTVFSENAEGDRIRVINAYSDYEEGYSVASRIAEMRMLKKYSYNDFAILYRTNAQSRIFEEALRKINIPYRIYGGLSFYQRKEIKDVIAYMRVVSNPNDEEALKRIINYPVRGIGGTTVGKIIAAANLNGVSLWTVLSDPLGYDLSVSSGTIAKLKEFRTLMENFIAVDKIGNVHELGVEIIRQTGMYGDLYADKTPEGVSRLQNIDELQNSLYAFVSGRLEEGRHGDVRVGDFLTEVSLLTDQDIDKDVESDRVTMMTVHSAKGLEFRNVFVVGMEENLFPSERSENQSEIEEERRLFYVALTRAGENVVLTYAKNRFRNGQSLSCIPSRFIGNISPQYLFLPGGAVPNVRNFPSHGFDRVSDRGLLGRRRVERPRPNLYFNPHKLSQMDDDDLVSRKYSRIGALAVGNTVLHERFGQGVIFELSGEGDNARAGVNFDNFGKKQLLLKFARFEVLKQ